MDDHRSLRVWHAAQDLEIMLVDMLTESRCRRMPGQRRQTIEAIISVPGNIAEGYAKPTTADKLKYYNHALGSLDEVRSRTSSLHRGRIITEREWLRVRMRIAVVRKMLVSLIEAVERQR